VKPAGTDPFPAEIEIVRGRRRTVELSLEGGKLVARVPRRIARAELESLLAHLRESLWAKLRRKSVFDDDALAARAKAVARRDLPDLDLPPYTVRFSSRQRRRWGSCTLEEGRGRIRLTDRLIGHPAWVLDHVLLHELIHLVIPDHGEEFQRLLSRATNHERALGYLQALENVEQLGLVPHESVARRLTPPTEREASLPLFAGLGDDEPAVSPSPNPR
jgi:predicted metal-dependent hydrolase